MTKRSIIKLLALADAYQKTAQENVNPGKEDQNQRFQAQRERLEKFYHHFVGKVRAILHEMAGDIFTLRQRKFDPQMLEMLDDVRNNLEYIYKKTDAKNPYPVAHELVDYILERSTMATLENLEFLIKHHLEQTKPTGSLPAFTYHAQVNSIEKLIGFAYATKAYMDANPLLDFPRMTPTPQVRNPFADPSFSAAPDDKTSVPTAVLPETPPAKEPAA